MKYTKFEQKYGECYAMKQGFLETYMQGNTKKVRDTRNKLVDGVWNVHPIHLTDSQVFVVCPLCGEIHFHGLGDGSYSGGRTIDCDCSAYNIELIVA